MAQTEGQGAAILTLPDELLFPILQELVHIEYPPFREGFREPFLKPCDFAIARALILTCRRFHQLVTPLLYADLKIQAIGTCDVRPDDVPRTKLLYRTFRTNTSLWPHCRRLEIDIGSGWPYSKTAFERDSPAKNLFYIVVDFLTWLTNITGIRVSAWPQHRQWGQNHPPLFPTEDDFLRLLRLASEQLHCLKHLELATHDGAALDMSTLVTGVGGIRLEACLRSLDLSGVSHYGTERDWESLRARAGTSPITKLVFRYFLQSSRALEALVMWPAKLTSFEFSMPMADHYSGEFAVTKYTLGVMQPILSRQKDSLAYIRIEELLQEGLYDFDVTRFCSLKSLWLSHDLTGTDATSVANLIAPSCEEFCWNMMLEDQQCSEVLDSFHQAEEDWLRAFARAAIERNSSLHRIRVLYFPEFYTFTHDLKSLEYPWDRLDRIAREIEPYGIHLSYNTPLLTREEFFDDVVNRPAQHSPLPSFAPLSSSTSSPSVMESEVVEINSMTATQDD